MNSRKVILNLAPPYLNGQLHLGHFYEFSLWYPFYNSLDSKTRKHLFSQYEGILEGLINYDLTATLGLDVLGLPISRDALKQLGKEWNNVSPEVLFSKCEQLIAKNTIEVKKMFKTLGLYDLRLLFEYTTKDLFFEQTLDRLFKQLGQVLSLDYAPQIYCKNCQTTLSNSEVEKVMENLYAYYFKVFDQETSKSYEIMTTRPEFLVGAVALVCNPEDDRYKDLIGKKLTLVLNGKEKVLPVYASKKIHTFVGTGLVFLAKWGGTLDLELSRDLDLEGSSSLYDQKGEVLKETKEFLNLQLQDYSHLLLNKEYLKNFERRELRELVKVLRHTERSDCKEETRYVSKQGIFLTMGLQTKQELRKIIEDLHVFPNTSKNYLLKNLEDLRKWCLSRDSFYYSFKKTYKEKDFKVDTWLVSSFTQAYQPLEDLKEFEVWRLQGTEILRTWGLYSIYLSYLLNKKNVSEHRFSKIFTHRHVLDEEGKKISKSKKNGPSLESLKNYPPQALRYYFCQKPLDKDFIFKEKELKDVVLFLRKFYNLRKKIKQEVKKEELVLDRKKMSYRCSSEEKNYSLNDYLFTLEDVNLRFKKYFTQEVVNFEFGKMCSYVKFMVYKFSTKFNKKERIFENVGGSEELALLEYSLGLVECFLKTFDLKYTSPDLNQHN